LLFATLTVLLFGSVLDDVSPTLHETRL